MYVTVWYGVYRPSDRRFAYASAGHPPALLIGAAGELLERLATGNLAVGMMEDAEFVATDTTVPPGGRLYVYSDGVYEIVTVEGHEWRLNDFVETVTAASVNETGELDRIEKHVRKVMQGELFDDDVSILVARFP